MKFGIREICDVVLKAKAAQKIGNKIFYANEPVLYFDTLKSSSMEGASTTVYAQGGRGNTRLVAWEGERTVTFTMEDALISPEGFMILTGAGLIESGEDTPIYQHMTETVDIEKCAYTEVTLTQYKITKEYFDIDDEGNVLTTKENKKVVVEYGFYENEDAAKADNKDTEFYTVEIVASSAEADKDKYIEPFVASSLYTIPLTKVPYLPTGRDGNYAYIMLVKNGEIISEPLIPMHLDKHTEKCVYLKQAHKNYHNYQKGELVTGSFAGSDAHNAYTIDPEYFADLRDKNADSVIVDYYVEHKNVGAAKQIEISAESFGGNFYLEASTLFRDTNGSDLPAEFIIPNCKIQSNFNFSMASSGDPSTFTFTMDAFPDYTRFDRSKKVLAAIQILGADEKASLHRHATAHEFGHEETFAKKQ